MFGPKPEKWSDNTVLTENIFLDSSALPSLEPDLEKFISEAKESGFKVVVLAFSSMPVSARRILKIAVKIIARCTPEVCVVALIGNHQFNLSTISDGEKHEAEVVPSAVVSQTVGSMSQHKSTDSLASYVSDFSLVDGDGTGEDTEVTLNRLLPFFSAPMNFFRKLASIKKLRETADEYIREKRLFVAKKAPFGRLFPLMDCIVAHGGLGTTGDAIRSSVPVIITG